MARHIRPEFHFQFGKFRRNFRRRIRRNTILLGWFRVQYVAQQLRESFPSKGNLYAAVLHLVQFHEKTSCEILSVHFLSPLPRVLLGVSCPDILRRTQLIERDSAPSR